MEHNKTHHMKAKLLPTDKANKIYDLLVKIGGAKEDERVDFIYHHCTCPYGCLEWRFRGKLGQGGKYRSSWNGVTYYPETETPEMNLVAEKLNKELKLLNNLDSK